MLLLLLYNANVQRARNLNFKGKNDTNDAFVVIGLGKDKFQTSIKEKAPASVEWHEECELAIPSQGNTAALSLTVYHRNALGLDEFLGQVQLPLSEFDVYERPRNRWHKLRGKPEKDRKKGEKERGELEVRVAFTVKSGSLLDVTDKKKNKSITSLKNLGGSLMSLGHKEKANIKSFAKSVSHKIDKIAHKPSKKKRKESQDSQGFPQELMRSRQRFGDADPGVISDSDEDDFGFSEEVRVNTRSSSPYSTVSRGSSLQQEDEGITLNNTSHLSESHAPPKPARLGGNLKEVPTIAVESPVPTPSPEPSPEPPTRQQPLPDSQPSTIPLTFPNLTPITLPGQNASTMGSSSPDSALTNSLSSNNGNGAKDSLGSRESSPEPIPAQRKVFPEPPPVVTSSPTTTSDSNTTKGNETPPSEPVPPLPKTSPPKTSTKSPQDSLAPAKPVRSARSTSLTDPPANTPKLLQAPTTPNKSRSLSTSATPKGLELGMFSPTTKESKGKGFALAALASASSKMSMIDSEPTLSTPSSRHNSEQTHGSVEAFPPPTPPTPGASVFSFSSDSGPNTPKDSSSGPSPAPTSSSSSRGTPGLAERPGAAVVRSGSLHEKPTSQPVLDEWERKLYGRNAIVGSMENMTHSDSRSSLNTSQSSSTQELHRIEEHRSRFPEMKVLTLDRKLKDDGDEVSESSKKRWGGKGGLKAKLFGSSRERIGEEDGRVVEGGNDRLPHPPTRQSRLPQEIHDKFAGKSREDLMETIVTLQATLEKNARHTRDLEDYIDDLLLRVMETTPQLLQASTTKSKTNKVFGNY
ncbi:rab11 family-interacting protein 1-like isoform X1 [Scylla paramamosain]|uniref:rab11 family-interacting protein 1-like isoform X1 n=1 Tax=Scylla paramamosain TaxID=85552 RepID=UPI0030830528